MGAICIGDTFFITDDGADYVTGMLEWNCAVYFQETLFIIQYIEQLFKRVESKATEHRKNITQISPITTTHTKTTDLVIECNLARHLNRNVL